ncbi:hypothetical protein C8Q74DRAFT_1222214 [Fomes fomentarius]|nr:hypothetical protein C8Q74DRAFT_1222214 [Fomes fomentarius]
MPPTIHPEEVMPENTQPIGSIRLSPPFIPNRRSSVSYTCSPHLAVILTPIASALDIALYASVKHEVGKLTGAPSNTAIALRMTLCVRLPWCFVWLMHPIRRLGHVATQQVIHSFLIHNSAPHCIRKGHPSGSPIGSSSRCHEIRVGTSLRINGARSSTESHTDVHRVLNQEPTQSTASIVSGRCKYCLDGAPVEKPPGSGGAAIYQLVEQSSLASLVLLASACSRL